MRTTLRRAVTIAVAAAALALSVVTVSSAAASADPYCRPGTNWDGRVCR